MSRRFLAAFILCAISQWPVQSFSSEYSIIPKNPMQDFSSRLYMKINWNIMVTNGYQNDRGAVMQWQIQGLPFEGLRSSLFFDPVYYLKNNKVPREKFGLTDYENANRHFFTEGIYQGLRGSLEFDPQFYLKQDPNLAATIGPNNYVGAAQHFVNYGLPLEGRRGSADFDVHQYLSTTPELSAALGPQNYLEAFLYWIAQGKYRSSQEYANHDCSSNGVRRGYYRIFISQRNDGQPGSGTRADPYDGSTADKFDTILREKAEDKLENLIVCIGEGRFLTKGTFDYVMYVGHESGYGQGFTVYKNWKIHGTGIDKTTLVLDSTFSNYNSIISTFDDQSSGVEVSDMTFDLNYDSIKSQLQNQSPPINLHGVNLRSDNGGHFIHHIRVTNAVGNASEAFPVWVYSVKKGTPSSHNNVIEHVVLDHWRGGKCTAIAIAGASGEVRYNTVLGHQIAFGGWSMENVSFHDNFSIGSDYGFNCDSLKNRNIDFSQNQIINPTQHGLNMGGGGEYDAFKIHDNFFQMDKHHNADGILFGGHVTNAHVFRNFFMGGHHTRAIDMTGGHIGHNSNNSFQRNQIFGSFNLAINRGSCTFNNINEFGFIPWMFQNTQSQTCFSEENNSNERQ